VLIYWVYTRFSQPPPAFKCRIDQRQGGVAASSKFQAAVSRFAVCMFPALMHGPVKRAFYSAIIAFSAAKSLIREIPEIRGQKNFPGHMRGARRSSRRPCRQSDLKIWCG
jgi:hypothetical protein